MADVVDSSGWIEYLTDGANADAFEAATNATDPVIVPTIAIYEVYKYTIRIRDAEAAAIALAVMKRGRVIDLDLGLALHAAQLSAAHRLPMADSIILATARRFGVTLWTQDIDFAGIDRVNYLPKA